MQSVTGFQCVCLGRETTMGRQRNRHTDGDRQRERGGQTEGDIVFGIDSHS